MSEDTKSKYPWGWWAGTTDDYFDLGGPLATRAHAIAAGQAVWDGHFYIVEAVTAEYRAPSAEEVIGLILENNEDVIHEHYPEVDGPADQVKAAEAEIDAFLVSWLDRHKGIFKSPTAFGATRNLERIEAPVRCEPCNGRSVIGDVVCDACGGRGAVWAETAT